MGSSKMTFLSERLNRKSLRIEALLFVLYIIFAAIGALVGVIIGNLVWPFL